MTANRLCEPESKLSVWHRWLSSVYLPSCDGFKLNHIYEAMDLIFYDTTTASFHVDQEDDGQRHENATVRTVGHSKEGTWFPQVVVALAVTCEGIPCVQLGAARQHGRCVYC